MGARLPLFQQPANGSYLEPILLSESNRRGKVGHTCAWKSRDRTPGAASSHVRLVRAMTQSLRTVPQRDSSKFMSITWVSWERQRVNVDENLMMAVQTQTWPALTKATVSCDQ